MPPSISARGAGRGKGEDIRLRLRRARVKHGKAPLKILGIETSCDETAAAVVESGRIVHSNVVASQAEIHAQYGGIVPEVASRQHMITLIPVVQQALENAGIALPRKSINSK